MITIELTDVQRQALRTEQGKPVDVVDPATQQRYVLLAREQYERVRSLVEGRLGQGPTAQEAPRGAPAPEGQPQRIRLRELPTPPEVAEALRQRRKRLRIWRWKHVQEEEDQLKLQHYFGGQPVYVLRTPEGPLVIPIEERYLDTPDLRYILLTADERACAYSTIPPRLFDGDSEILTPFPNESPDSP